MNNEHSVSRRVFMARAGAGILLASGAGSAAMVKPKAAPGIMVVSGGRLGRDMLALLHKRPEQRPVPIAAAWLPDSAPCLYVQGDNAIVHLSDWRQGIRLPEVTGIFVHAPEALSLEVLQHADAAGKSVCLDGRSVSDLRDFIRRASLGPGGLDRHCFLPANVLARIETAQGLEKNDVGKLRLGFSVVDRCGAEADAASSADAVAHTHLRQLLFLLAVTETHDYSRVSSAVAWRGETGRRLDSVMTTIETAAGLRLEIVTTAKTLAAPGTILRGDRGELVVASQAFMPAADDSPMCLVRAWCDRLNGADAAGGNSRHLAMAWEIMDNALTPAQARSDRFAPGRYRDRA